MRNHLKGILEGLFKFLVAAGILTWLYRSGNLRFDFIDALLKQPSVLALCLFITAISLFLNNERWRTLLHSQGLIYTRLETAKLTLIGQFFNFAMPGGVGGDIIKSYYLTRMNQGQKTRSVMTVLMDRLMGLHAILVLGFLAMLFDLEKILSVPELRLVFLAVTLGTIAYTTIVFIFQSRREWIKRTVRRTIEKLPLKHRFQQVYDTFNAYGQQKSTLGLAFLYSLISQSLAIAFMYIVCRTTYGVELSAHSFFIIVPVGFILTAIPISPAGVGVGQAAFLFLFGVYSPELKHLGPSALTAWQTSLLLFGLIGGMIYLFNRTSFKKVEEKIELSEASP